MLKVISWNQYFVFVGIAAIGWYGYILLRYAGRSSTDNNRTFSPADRTGFMMNEGKPILTTLQGGNEGSNDPVDGAENEEDFDTHSGGCLEHVCAWGKTKTQDPTLRKALLRILSI